MITAEKLVDTTGFLALQHEWEELLESSSNDCLFLSWDWMYTWWKHFSAGRRLCIITVRRAGQLVAIAPLVTRPRDLSRLQPFRVLEFIGSGDVGSDYLSMLIRRGHEADSLQAITDLLAKQDLVLDLSRFDCSSPQMSALIRQLRDSGWKSTSTVTEVSPYINLSSYCDWESFVSSRGKSHRANLRKRIKNLYKRFHVSFLPVRDEDEREEALQCLVDWHLERWRTRGGSTAMHQQALVNFHHDMTRTAMDRGWLRLFSLKLDHKPAASLYCFSYKGKYYFYQMGFDDNFSNLSIGLAGTALAIKWAIEEGAQEYDFLHGDESYKYLWTQEQRELQRLDLYPPGVTGAVYKRSMLIRDEIKKVLCYAQLLKTV